MIVEYCRFGSLRQYLLKKRPDYIDTMDDELKWNAANKNKEAQSRGTAGLNYINVFHGDNDTSGASPTDASDDTVPLTTKDLVCFSFQIARGMEFLASRKVRVV